MCPHTVVRRGAALLACVASAAVVAFACTSYSGEEAEEKTDAGSPSPGTEASTADVDAKPIEDAGVATCPARYMPQEGTYLYINYLGGDTLTIDDASIATQPFSQPYFVTLKHNEPSAAGTGCWTMTAYLSEGSAGRHDHSFKFCNVCPAATPTSNPRLDLVEERDYFVATAVGAVQTSLYTCGTPNPFLVPGTDLDAAITQAACTGTTNGPDNLTIQVAPLSYTYRGQEFKNFQNSEAGVMCDYYTREVKVQVANGGDSTQSVQHWWLDIDSGLPTWVISPVETRTRVGAADIEFRFGLVMVRQTPDVSPLLPPRDAGL